MGSSNCVVECPEGYYSKEEKCEVCGNHCS